MWPHPGHLDRSAATLPSQAPVGPAQGAPDLEQSEQKEDPLVRPSFFIFKEGILSSRRYLPTYLDAKALLDVQMACVVPGWYGKAEASECSCLL